MLTVFIIIGFYSYGSPSNSHLVLKPAILHYT